MIHKDIGRPFAHWEGRIAVIQRHIPVPSLCTTASWCYGSAPTSRTRRSARLYCGVVWCTVQFAVRFCTVLSCTELHHSVPCCALVYCAGPCGGISARPGTHSVYIVLASRRPPTRHSVSGPLPRCGVEPWACLDAYRHLLLPPSPASVLQTKEHREYLDQQFVLLGAEAVAYANKSEFIWAFASVASRSLSMPATSKLPTFYTQKVVAATPETLAAAEKVQLEKAKGGGEAKKVKGLSWEDEFLFDDEELEKLQALAERAAGKGEGQQEQPPQEEVKTVSVLLPLVDLFDYNEEANIRLEVLHNTLHAPHPGPQSCTGSVYGATVGRHTVLSLHLSTPCCFCVTVHVAVLNDSTLCCHCMRVLPLVEGHSLGTLVQELHPLSAPVLGSPAGRGLGHGSGVVWCVCL